MVFVVSHLYLFFVRNYINFSLIHIIFLYNNYIQRCNIYYIFTYHLTTLNAIYNFLSSLLILYFIIFFFRSFLLFVTAAFRPSCSKQKRLSCMCFVCACICVSPLECVCVYILYTYILNARIHIYTRKLYTYADDDCA